MEDPMGDPGVCIDDLSTANTEDSLLGSRKSTETISTVLAKDDDEEEEGTRSKCGEQGEWMEGKSKRPTPAALCVCVL